MTWTNYPAQSHPWGFRELGLKYPGEHLELVRNPLRGILTIPPTGPQTLTGSFFVLRRVLR